jgi:8-oxo-dGTP diphosphatase
MRTRAAAILIEDDQIALIERHRAGRHYFTIPGGGVDQGETPEQAVVREMLEETGLTIVIQKLIAEVWFQGDRQLYYLVERLSGEFGTGDGVEMLHPQPLNPNIGTYDPIWMKVVEIPNHPLVPKEIAQLIVRSHPSRWPLERILIHEGDRE